MNSTASIAGVLPRRYREAPTPGFITAGSAPLARTRLRGDGPRRQESKGGLARRSRACRFGPLDAVVDNAQVHF
jgi:hypothetical protein